MKIHSNGNMANGNMHCRNGERGDDRTDCVTMRAKVLEVEDCALLVLDCEECRKVLVLTEDACHFCEGDLICIWYNGVMTRSIPPQIRADRIRKLLR